MAPVIDISELRESLRKKFPAAHRHVVSPEAVFIVPEETTILHFAPATLNEIVASSPSQSMTVLISRLLDEERDLPIALIDGRDSFDPASHGSDRCSRLFWIRCSNTDQIIQATDLLLRDGNLPLIFLDLHLVSARELGRIPAPLWHRFRNEVRESGSTLVVLSSKTLVTAAHTRHFIEGTFTLDHIESLTPGLRIIPDTTSRMKRTLSS